MRCSAEVVPVRAAPLEGSEQVTQALYREPLRVLKRHGDWTLVITAYGYEGWLLTEALEQGEGELPGPSALPPLEFARRFVGAPYAWGGLTADGIDCSGLVHMAYRLSGRLVPRDAWQQESAGTPVAEPDIAPGDLTTYSAGARVDHIAFWLGEGRILHATGRDDLGVVEEPEPETLRTGRRLVVRL